MQTYLNSELHPKVHLFITSARNDVPEIGPQILEHPVAGCHSSGSGSSAELLEIGGDGVREVDVLDKNDCVEKSYCFVEEECGRVGQDIVAPPYVFLHFLGRRYFILVAVEEYSTGHLVSARLIDLGAHTACQSKWT